MTAFDHDLKALIAAERQAPPTPSAEAAARGWSRLRGQLGAVAVLPQFDVPPAVVESAAGMEAAATAAPVGWGWMGKAIATAIVTVTVGGVGVAASGVGRAPSTTHAASSTAPAAIVAAPAAAMPAQVPAVVPAELPTPPVAATMESPPVIAPAPTPGPRRSATPPRAEAGLAAGEAALAGEAPLIAAALRALSQGHAAQALAVLERHRERYPRGTMTEDREALRISALCRSGRIAEATELRTEFFSRWPNSPHAARVRGACAPDAD